MTTLSLAMIVKNEAANLPHCLASVRDLVDEMVVVDTGSSDDTVAIAESHGARVSHFAWVDDFAAARNEGLRQCTGDWVLVLDADETVDALDHAKIREACGQEKTPAFFMTLRNYFLDGGGVLLDQAIKPNDGRYDQGSEYSYYADFQGLRLCRRYPDLRFEGRIHELLAPYFHARKLPVGSLDAVIHHFGKVDLVREAEKAVRYLRMAQDQVAADPKNMQHQFNLMLQAATARDWHLVIAAAKACLALSPKPPIAVLTTLALAYQETGQPAEAIPPLKKVLATDPAHALALSRLPISYAMLGKVEEARSLLEKAIRKHPSIPAIRLALAETLLSHGLPGEAQAVFKAGVQACPTDPILWERLVKLDLQLDQQAQAAADAWAALRVIPGCGGGLWHALVAGFLLRSGETAKGRAVLEQGLSRHPHHEGLVRLRTLLEG